MSRAIEAALMNNPPTGPARLAACGPTGHNAEKSGEQQRGLSCANAQMCAAEYEQIQQHDYADNTVVRAEARL